MSRTPMSIAERSKSEIVPLSDALYQSVRRFKGGANEIARQTNRKASTLQHKLSPTADTHHLKPDEVEEIIRIVRDPGPIHSVIAAFGDAAWVDLREIKASLQNGKAGPAQVLTAISGVMRTHALLGQEVGGSLSRGEKLDARAVARCKLLIQEAMGSVLALDYVLDRAAEEPSQTAGLDLKP